MGASLLFTVFIISTLTSSAIAAIPFIPDQSGKLYHYTSSEHCTGISSTNKILSSTADKVYGTGVYLTQLSPTKPNEDIVFNNWAQDSDFLKKDKYVEKYIEFNSADLPDAEKKMDVPNIWVVPHDIDLGQTPHKICTRDKIGTTSCGEDVCSSGSIKLVSVILLLLHFFLTVIYSK